jgi:hypothetical protein
VVLGDREKQDGVHLEQARMMAWLEISEASWNDAKTRSDLDDLVVVFWARRRTTITKGSRKQPSYQEVQDDKASPMAKRGRRGCSCSPAIPRWSTRCGQ